MTTFIINNVPTTGPQGAIAYKYADPIEDARWVYDESDAADIAREDNSLLVWPTVTPNTNTPAK